MRTTLKRGLGRLAAIAQGEEAVFPTEPLGRVSFYRAPTPAPRSALRSFTRVLSTLALALLAVVLGVAGGAFLWFDRSVNLVQNDTPALAKAAKQLALPLPGRPAIALLLGVDSRDGSESGSQNTDAMMLVRADPATSTISLLSFPRDLNVPIYCSNRVYGQDRINSALADCGPQGVLETVQHLTGLPINYLITVDFHGFKKIVNELGGVWLDVDRSYYNKNVGTAATDYSNIDLQPGYQLLSGGEALSFVRFRHTDSDLYRLAREQEFVRAIKEQVAASFNPLHLPGIVSAITGNVQLASKTHVGDTTVLEWALFGATLPAGHIVQVNMAADELSSLDVGGASELSATPSAIQQTVSEFTHPHVVGVRRAPRPRPHPAPAAPPVPPVHATTLTVLNGNGVPGAASSAAGLLGARGYRVLAPPGQAPANAPSMDYAETKIYFDPSRARAAAAADSLARLMRPAAVQALPADPRLRALDPGSMLLVVLGKSFSGQLSLPQPALRRPVPAAPAQTLQAQIQPAAGAAGPLIVPLVHRVPFELETPTVLAAGSVPDSFGGDQPVRLYSITAHDKAVRLVFVTGGNQYWGLEETSWAGAPVLGDDNVQRSFKGRSYSLYYANGHLHMVVLRADGATYWVVNTLLNDLSNPTMIAIAEGLRPLGHPV